MAIKTVIICDVCGKERGSVNHWFTLDLHSNGVLDVVHGTSLISDGENIRQVCGQEHALLLISRFLSGKTLDLEACLPLPLSMVTSIGLDEKPDDFPW